MPDSVLIIEDNPENLELMRYLLRAFGYEPLIAECGEAGFKQALEETPRLILSDIHLPDIDGYTLARRFKADAVLRSVPLVAVTALAMVGDREKVLTAGFDGYITKPIDPETFVASIEKFLGSEPRASRPARCEDIPPVASTGSKKGKIVVVDDRQINLNLKRSLLEPLGYTVLTAVSKAGAIDLVRRELPDLILSDLRMADGTGFELIKVVKADPELKEIPFIFITSTFCDEASRAKGLSLGADRFLFRPIEPKELLAEIEACLRGRERK